MRWRTGLCAHMRVCVHVCEIELGTFPAPFCFASGLCKGFLSKSSPLLQAVFRPFSSFFQRATMSRTSCAAHCPHKSELHGFLWAPGVPAPRGHSFPWLQILGHQGPSRSLPASDHSNIVFHLPSRNGSSYLPQSSCRVHLAFLLGLLLLQGLFNQWRQQIISKI